jgi:hypothetical protein
MYIYISIVILKKFVPHYKKKFAILGSYKRILRCANMAWGAQGIGGSHLSVLHAFHM